MTRTKQYCAGPPFPGTNHRSHHPRIDAASEHEHEHEHENYGKLCCGFDSKTGYTSSRSGWVLKNLEQRRPPKYANGRLLSVGTLPVACLGDVERSGIEIGMRKILLLTGMTPIIESFIDCFPYSQTRWWWIGFHRLNTSQLYRNAERLSLTVRHDESVVVCGVSFGGIIARELAYRLDAASCVLISSVRSPTRITSLVSHCPRNDAAFCAIDNERLPGLLPNAWPRPFRSPATWRMRKLAGNSGQWHRWATCGSIELGTLAKCRSSSIDTNSWRS